MEDCLMINVIEMWFWIFCEPAVANTVHETHVKIFIIHISLYKCHRVECIIEYTLILLDLARHSDIVCSPVEGISQY